LNSLLISPTRTDLTECTFWLPLIESQVYLIWRLTFDILTSQNTWIIAFYTPEYQVSGYEDKCFCNKTTSSTFCSVRPFGSSWLCLMNLFTTAPAPSWGPLLWPVPKKSPKHRTPTCQIWVSINKIPWGFAFELKRTPIWPHLMLSGLKPPIQHTLSM